MKIHLSLVGFVLLTIIFANSMSNVEATVASGKPIWEVGSSSVCGDKLCSEIPENEYQHERSDIEKTSSPRIQYQSGIEINDVVCNEDLELVMKQKTGEPACVKPSSVSVLIKRGWAIHVLPEYIKDENNNSEIFKLGKFQTESEIVNYGKSTGYLAKPNNDGVYPGIVMIHEWGVLTTT